MSARFRVLGVAALLGWLLTCESAQAHNLEAEATLRPGWQIQVESWYETGDAPAGARVEVYRAGGELLTEGRLNEHGLWLFSYRQLEPLRIVIRAGGGHRAELQLTAEKLTRYSACSLAACLTPTPSPWLAAALLVPACDRLPSPAPEAVTRRNAGTQWKNLLIGVLALLAVATVAWQWQRSRAQEPTASKSTGG